MNCLLPPTYFLDLLKFLIYITYIWQARPTLSKLIKNIKQNKVLFQKKRETKSILECKTF